MNKFQKLVSNAWSYYKYSKMKLSQKFGNSNVTSLNSQTIGPANLYSSLINENFALPGFCQNYECNDTVSHMPEKSVNSFNDYIYSQPNISVSPVNTIYVSSSSFTTTVTTSVISNCLMSTPSSDSCLSYSSVHPLLNNSYNERPEFSQFTSKLYQNDNFERKKCFTNNPIIKNSIWPTFSSHTLESFDTKLDHTFQPNEKNQKVLSGFITQSKYKTCESGNLEAGNRNSSLPLSNINNNESFPNQFSPSITPACFSLPPIEIEKFDGNISEYKEFQIKIKLILTMANYPEALKVIFLKSFLSGDPLSSVSGIMPDDPDAFSAIWDILDEDYGAPDLVRDHHLSLLLSINSWSPCITNKDLKHLYRHISTHYTMLKHFGSEALEEAEAVKIFILPLLTGHAGYKVAKLHQSGKNYNIPEILKILKSIISHQKFVESAKSIKSNLELNKKHLLSSKKNESSLNQIPNVHQNVYSPESNVCTKLEKSSTSISYLEKSSTLRYNCPICETDSHHHSKCKKYQNRDEFWCHIKKNRLCANCLRPGHVWKECFKEHSCQLGCLRLDKHAPVLCRKFYL